MRWRLIGMGLFGSGLGEEVKPWRAMPRALGGRHEREEPCGDLAGQIARKRGPPNNAGDADAGCRQAVRRFRHKLGDERLPALNPLFRNAISARRIKSGVSRREATRRLQIAQERKRRTRPTRVATARPRRHARAALVRERPQECKDASRLLLRQTVHRTGPRVSAFAFRRNFLETTGRPASPGLRPR